MGGMPEVSDGVDHGPAVADRSPKGLSIGQRRELLAGPGGGRAAPGGDKVGGVLEAKFFVGCQGFHRGLRCVAMAADSARRQKRATPRSLIKLYFISIPKCRSSGFPLGVNRLSFGEKNDSGATWYLFSDQELAVKSSISLTDEQPAFAKELVEAGRYSSVSAVLQQGTDLLRQRMQDDDLQRTALKALLDQRSTGAFVSGGQMDKTIARMVVEKRRAHAVQS